MKKIIPSMAVEPCQEALDYYQRVFGGEIQNVQTAEANEMFKGHEGKIVHAELHVNAECILYLNDFMGEKKGEGNISLLLEMDSEEESNRIFADLKESGTVVFELQKTFWGALHGVVKDRFGVTWALNFSLK
jgi:PhnB protein